MTITVVIMIIIGIIMSFASFFLTEKFTRKEENLHMNLMTVDDDYEFSEHELRIIRRKIEDVIVNQAKDILYETNESLASMANEKTMALGDYAVAVCEEIEKNHREVMFLYSMLDDKQKEIMKTVKAVGEASQNVRETIEKASHFEVKPIETSESNELHKKKVVVNQLTALSERKREMDAETAKQQQVQDESVYLKEVEKSIELQDMKESLQEVENATKESSEEYVDSFEAEEQKQSDLEDMEDVFAEIDQTDVDFDEVLEEEYVESDNLNDIILGMHRNGNSIIDIAKQLGLGVGEVKLVIDLYRGE